jgi:hypothetical protein
VLARAGQPLASRDPGPGMMIRRLPVPGARSRRENEMRDRMPGARRAGVATDGAIGRVDRIMLARPCGAAC